MMGIRHDDDEDDDDDEHERPVDASAMKAIM